MFMPSSSIFICSSWKDFVDFSTILELLTLVPGAELDFDAFADFDKIRL
jgi:hypothetical protein